MTDTQKQHLLAYLGYYVGEIDGKFGPMSKEATKAFQRDYDGLEVDGIVGPDTEKSLKHAVAYGMPAKKAPTDFWGEIKYFKREEFKCRCGGKYCNGFPAEPSEKLLRLADRVREHFGAKAIVSSGVRCQKHNDSLPGSVPTSRHRIGTAMDFCIEGMPSSLVLAYVQEQSATHYAYAIDGSYVHMDVVE